MEITASRTGEQLVLSLTGRMDGTGALQVTAAIRQNLTDHDTVLIFDLGGVDYLSSAGLRVFQESARRMKERNGRIAVCRLQEFVRKLLASGGFFRVLAEYPDTASALSATALPPGPAGGDITLEGPGWTLAGRRLAGKPGMLTVTGSLSAIHAGTISPAGIHELPLPPGAFCTGIGALGATRETAAPLLGEMMQAGSMISWVPTDGNANPDFFTADDIASSGTKAFALFAASFSGPFSDILRITADSPEGMTLAEVYTAIFRYAATQYPEFSGACAVCLKATISGLCSSDIRQPLLAVAAAQAARGPVPLPAGKTMTEYPFDGTIIAKASAVDVKPRYAGDILVSVGYGVDPARAAGSFTPEQLAAIAYTDPRGTGTGPFVANHGLVFTSLPWDNAKPFEEQILSAPARGEFAALHNLLAITKVRSAVAGILPVAGIRNGA